MKDLVRFNKLKRRNLFLIVLPIFAVLFSSCLENKVIGKWQYIEYERSGIGIAQQLIYTFNEDHTGSMSFIVNDRFGRLKVGSGKFNWEIKKGYVVLRGTYRVNPKYGETQSYYEQFAIRGDRLIGKGNPFLRDFNVSFTLVKYQ